MAAAVPPPELLYSTPCSRCIVAYVRDGDFHAKIETVDKYVNEDFKDELMIEFDRFLLGMGASQEAIDGNDESVGEVVRDPRILELVDDYCKRAANETQRYGPFCELVNYITSKLGVQSIILTRNDPKCLHGAYKSERKPDVIALDSNNPFVANDRWKDYSAAGPRKVDWKWADVRYVFEFKLRTNEIASAPVVDYKLGQAAPTRSVPPKPSASAESTRAQSSGRSGSKGPGKKQTASPALRQSVSSSSTSRKRQLLEEVESEMVNWKRSKTDRETGLGVELKRQCGRYAIDLMSDVLNRRHVIECHILDGTLWMGYFDRGGPVYTEGLNFVSDLYSFILLIKTLAVASPADCGFLENVKLARDMEDGSTEDKDAKKQKQEDKPVAYVTAAPHELCLHHPLEIRAPYGLVTRGGRVFAATCETLDKGEPGRLYAVKLGWPLKKRPSEGMILDKGREELAKLDADPEHKKKYGDRKLAPCLPKVLLREDLDELAKEGSFRQKILIELSDSRNRVLRLLVFETLKPLYKVTSLGDFKKAVRDMVLAHYFLYSSDSRILHRDISLGNLMVRYEGDEVYGVLNDWDLAVMAGTMDDNHAGTRTGTRPYMSRDLLVPQPPLHLLRFDWESFLYVICMIGCRYSGGELVNPMALSEWYNEDDAALRGIKHEVLTSEIDFMPVFTDFYKPVARDWISPLQDMFCDGVLAHSTFARAQVRLPPGSNITFDMETLGGHVTWEKIWGILQK